MLYRLVCLFLLCPLLLAAQDTFVIKKDLQRDWTVYDNGRYVAASEAGALGNTIYFTIPVNEFSGDYLRLQFPQSFHVFIGGKLVAAGRGALTLKLDSLSRIFATPALMCAVHANGISNKKLQTIIVSKSKPAADANSLQRPGTFFRDFVILAGLILIVFLVVLVQLHPKLMSDYFSVTRIFSIREADEAQASGRVTGSSNVLLFIFFSLLGSLCLLIVLHHMPAAYTLPLKFTINSFWAAMGQWVKLGVVLLAILFLKMAITFSLSNLFGMRGIAGAHFVNWLRMLLVTGGVLLPVLFVYFISRGQNSVFYVTLLTSVIVILGGWIILVFLKLNIRTEHSLFHLFSYICATEIIPLLITVKVLFQ